MVSRRCEKTGDSALNKGFIELAFLHSVVPCTLTSRPWLDKRRKRCIFPRTKNCSSPTDLFVGMTIWQSAEVHKFETNTHANIWVVSNLSKKYERQLRIIIPGMALTCGNENKEVKKKRCSKYQHYYILQKDKNNSNFQKTVTLAIQS